MKIVVMRRGLLTSTGWEQTQVQCASHLAFHLLHTQKSNFLFASICFTKPPSEKDCPCWKQTVRKVETIVRRPQQELTLEDFPSQCLERPISQEPLPLNLLTKIRGYDTNSSCSFVYFHFILILRSTLYQDLILGSHILNIYCGGNLRHFQRKCSYCWKTQLEHVPW